LIAGANSRDGWHAPSEIETAAKTVTIVPNAGHLMMLQSPSSFAEVIKRIAG